MKRGIKSLIVCIAGSVFAISVKAQTALPASFMGYHSPYSPMHYSDNAGNTNKKWFVSRYSAVSAGYSFFKGGSFSYISAPIGLQLNRKLNNNLYAFAGVSVNPTYINFNQPILFNGANKGFYNNGMFGPNQFGVYPKAELGLMYVNDEKTFSISGSISVQRGGYLLPNRQLNMQQNNSGIRPNN